MTLRVAGDPDVPPCDEPGCILCGGPGGTSAEATPPADAGSATVRREPIEAARALAGATRIAALAEPLGHDAPVGKRYGVEELARAIEGLERALEVRGEDSDARELLRGDVERARAVFRAARAHHRVVVLEV